jgi:hypothetical protein
VDNSDVCVVVDAAVVVNEAVAVVGLDMGTTRPTVVCWLDSSTLSWKLGA